MSEIVNIKVQSINIYLIVIFAVLKVAISYVLIFFRVIYTVESG